jgi:hypothetical protein
VGIAFAGMYYAELREQIMKKDFNYWKNIHDKSSLELFNTDVNGQLWLKIKSIIRPALIKEFVSENKIIIKSSTVAKQFEELYAILSKSVERSHEILDEYIIEKNKQVLTSLDAEKLVSELYKMKTFEWGGDYKNSLDKYLISHYIKVISDYDELVSRFDTEINNIVKGYVLNSWYNHWSSILIEHIFKLHKNVLPTVGQIKNVDFFINNIPFDLKVTYFPSEYLKLKRKEKGYPVELTYLKSKAKELGINYDKNGSDVFYEITEKMKDKGTKACTGVLNILKEQNMEIIKEAQNNAKLLSKWLYENQGEVRFGSENRLFLVLIDTENFANSWKLKRNTELLTPIINKFLNKFIKKNINDLKVVFNYPGKPGSFTSLADVLFVIK